MAAAVAFVGVSACSDAGQQTGLAKLEPASEDLTLSMFRSGGAHPFGYVALGTSVSMGWMNDGVVGSSQTKSWTKLLADGAGVPFKVPSIDAPGCQPPLAAPLIAFKRVDGTSAAPSSTCAPNAAGVTLPAHNLAVENATAGEGLNATPETASAGRGPVTSRVLPSGMTQVTTMRSLRPLFVSVEFGGNELLPAQVGVVAPGVTVVPFETFRANYEEIISNVKATHARAVLVSIRTDLRNFPTIRTGAEIAAQRAAFAAYNVRVSDDCDASENFVFVRGKVPTAVLTGVAMAPLGVPYVLSCADLPGKVDYILTPADIQYLNALGNQMSDEIERQAAKHRYAVFSLGELYNTSKDGVPFDLEGFLKSATPYGPKISLDGVHPNEEGHRVLAAAARKAIIAQYLHRLAD
jgi:lysophospholipase L1-like esterase